MSFKYPWEEGTVLGAVHAHEEDAELADEQARRLEKGAANDWKAPSQALVEDVNKYGRDAWVHLQILKFLGVAMLVSSLCALPLLAHSARGSAVKQTDLFASFSRLSLVNADASRGLEVGPFELGFRGWPILGALASWQTIAILAPLCWLRFWRVPEAFEHPDLRALSTADFAVQVDGLLPMLPIGEHHRYDSELVRHFEAVLQESTGDGSPSFVCELVLVRDFGHALLAAQELVAAKNALNHMDGAPEPGKTMSRWRGTQQRRIRMQVEELTRQLEDAKVLEANSCSSCRG